MNRFGHRGWPVAVALVVSASCGQSVDQEEVTASDAESEVRLYALENGFPEPDEGFYLLSLGSESGLMDEKAGVLVGRGYFACNALDHDVLDHWRAAVAADGWTTDEQASALGSAVASLCPWHLETLDRGSG
ncbi:MAG TPA: DUF732 domain-containing protein [Acidimicrobiia bacterium]|nr:DUF732 domain-containing protein [Acidimicrobiia bacterium]